MGSVNLDNTGSGSAITLSSDGTSLLLDGTAIGGGGGSPDLYRDNAVSATTPVAAGNNGIAIGSNASNTTTHGSSNALAIGTNAVADYWATALGAGTDATGNSSLAIGYNSQATGSKSTAIMNSYASGTAAFAAVIDNNTATYGATGANSIAMGSLAKATGSDAVAIGDRNVASGGGSVALAARSTASGTNSVAIGFLSDATGPGSVALGSGYGFNGPQATIYNAIAIGQGSLSDKIGKVAISGFAFAASGDGQHGIFVLRVATTNATATPLITGPDYYGSSTADTENQVVLPNNSAYSFSGTIIARQQAADGSNYASWEIKGALLRDANAASTVLGNGIVNKLFATAGASAWAIALTADTTNGGLKVEATGAAATDIRWVATVNTSEVTYA